MNASNSFKDTDAQRPGYRGRRDPYHKKPKDRNPTRRYDCEDYLDCLLEASMANMRGLPCKDCDRYVSRYSEEEYNRNLGLWSGA